MSDISQKKQKIKEIQQRFTAEMDTISREIDAIEETLRNGENT